jgi:Peptidase family M48
MTLTSRRSKLDDARFAADLRELEAIQADPQLGPVLAEARAGCQGHGAREHYLANAVRVDPAILPQLAAAFQDIQQRCQLDIPLEAYVYAGAEINAAVVGASDHYLVVLSSAAVERLSPEQLDFVIGHELGHACFGHLEMPIQAVLNGPNNLQPKQTMQLLAWQRQAEISADRAGLLCCGSLDAAATALFKTLSGLALPNLCIDARQFACQWDALAEEMSRQASDRRWLATHPFPPLRMRALICFWECDRATQLIAAAPGGESHDSAERQIESMLAMMDPLARDRQDVADPMLRDFFLWGGLYIAAANDDLDQSELDHLRSLVGAEAIDEAFASENFSLAALRERFLAAREQRRTPLSALEVHRIFAGLAAVAAADGVVDSHESNALRDLAAAFGLHPQFVETVMAQAA